MKIKFDITKILKPLRLLVTAGAVTLLSILVLLVFSGKTAPEYTLSNLKFSLLIKAFMTAVFTLGFTIIYFFFRFKKNGAWFGLFTAFSAVINTVVAFALCIITRAPLGELSFAVMMLSVFVTYLTAILFNNNLDIRNSKKKKNMSIDLYARAAKKTFNCLLFMFMTVTLIIVVTFIISLIYGAKVLALFALPTILTTGFAVVFTLGFGCKLFYNKTNR